MEREWLNISPAEGKIYFRSDMWFDKNNLLKKQMCINLIKYARLKYPEELRNEKLEFIDIKNNQKLAECMNDVIEIM